MYSLRSSTAYINMKFLFHVSTLFKLNSFRFTFVAFHAQLFDSLRNALFNYLRFLNFQLFAFTYNHSLIIRRNLNLFKKHEYFCLITFLRKSRKESKSPQPVVVFKQICRAFMSLTSRLLQMQTGAMRKVKECRKLKDEGKMTEFECGAVAERANHVAYCMCAESSHFHSERIRSFALAQRDLVEKQAQFFEKLAVELRGTLKYFDEVRIDL